MLICATSIFPSICLFFSTSDHLFIYSFFIFIFLITFFSYVRGVFLCNSCLCIILVNFQVSFCLLVGASNKMSLCKWPA